MDLFESEPILKWELKGAERDRAATMIDHILRVAGQGGGTVPLEPILKILKCPPEEIRRILSRREPIRIQNPSGSPDNLEGTFINRGAVLEASIPRMEMTSVVMKLEQTVQGRFQAQPGRVILMDVQGMTVLKELIERENDEAMTLSFQVDRLILKPESLAVF